MSRTLGAVVLNASLTLMSILVVVITVLIIEYKRVYPDPAIAGPILKAVWGTTGASVMAGVIALLALTHLQSGRGSISYLMWPFGALILFLTAGIPMYGN
jgi:hypothetical protein